MLRLLLFSDIHGNGTALEAVLEDSARHGPYDLVVCAGDLIWAGPHPRAVLARLRELCCDDPAGQAGKAICLMGNCDRFVLDEFEHGAPAGKKADRFRRHRRWMLGQLAPGDLDFLRRMPFHHRVCPSADHDLLVVHANPHNLDDPIYATLSDEQIDAVIGQPDFSLLAFGHIHIPFVRSWRGRLLVNVASVGLCQDGDARAAYTVLTWAGGSWSVGQYRVEYDVAAVAHDMRTGGLPRGAHFAGRLLAARYE
jgi:predicted phosphodiesterase